MTTYILAGDIGGTKTNLALYALEGGDDISLVLESSFPSTQYAGLEDVIADFRSRAVDTTIAAGAFGIAGPVLDGRVKATNLPWKVDASAIRQAIGGGQVRLMNDLEATAYGALFLPAAEILTLNAGKPRHGNRAVIAAGTGLGQAFLFWDGQSYRPVATEGGHVDFPPRNDTEVALLRFLTKQHNGRVSYERVLSGPGLVSIFNFLCRVLQRPVAEALRARLQTEDAAAVIGEAGVAGSCRTCTEAVDMFVSLYGAQAGNLALTVMSVGGVYIGGGIVPKLLPKMTVGGFMQSLRFSQSKGGSRFLSGFMRSFTDKGRFSQLLHDMPVRIILNPKVALIGAAHAASRLQDYRISWLRKKSRAALDDLL